MSRIEPEHDPSAQPRQGEWISAVALVLIFGTCLVNVGIVAVFAGEAWRCQRQIHWRNWSAVAFGALPGVLATVFFKHAWVATGEVDRFLGPGLLSRLADPQRWFGVAVFSAFGGASSAAVE